MVIGSPHQISRKEIIGPISYSLVQGSTTGTQKGGEPAISYSYPALVFPLKQKINLDTKLNMLYTTASIISINLQKGTQ